MNYEAKKIIEYLKRFDFSKGERPVILEEEYKNLVSYVERLNNIIKEVREYIESNEKEYGSLEDNEKIILGILDKESK